METQETLIHLSDTRKSVIIIALDILITTYKDLLETKEIIPTQEDIEFCNNVISEAESLIYLLGNVEKPMEKPQWKKGE